MAKVTQIYDNVIEKTKNGTEVPYIDKNGVKVHKLTIFEDIVLRNLNNLNTTALEIVNNGTKMTYLEFFKEVEKYISTFQQMGLKEHDVVSLCLPVGIEFICSYFALTTIGVTVNALNIMFILSEGVKHFLDERCSQTLICDEEFYKLLQMNGAFNDKQLKKLIITGDATYTHFTDRKNIEIGNSLPGVEIIEFNDFLKSANLEEKIKVAEYNEKRISTLNYTSGSTGRPKCMGHSDLAPLFLNAAHDTIRRDEYIGDRTLLTIPLQHPTGLFYAMVFQLAQGKTLVLEPRYDKRLFAEDIKNNNIQHAVQARNFYAQLVQDRAEGRLKQGDFCHFRNAYSGGEGVPSQSCMDINDTLNFAGCPNTLLLGYGRSEDGSSTVIPYNLYDRANTCGVPLPGIQLKIVDSKTLKDIPQVEGAKGETLVSTPVQPIGHCYLDIYNKPGMPDGSFVDENGVRWARMNDIGTYKKLESGVLSYLGLGRSSDFAIKGKTEAYLFDLKEMISNIPGVQECEVLKMPHADNTIVNVHIVLKENYKERKEEIIRKIYEKTGFIDAIKFYNAFATNATSGKCDREAMSQGLENYYTLENNEVQQISFEIKDGRALKRTR